MFKDKLNQNEFKRRCFERRLLKKCSRLIKDGSLLENHSRFSGALIHYLHAVELQETYLGYVDKGLEYKPERYHDKKNVGLSKVLNAYKDLFSKIVEEDIKNNEYNNEVSDVLLKHKARLQHGLSVSKLRNSLLYVEVNKEDDFEDLYSEGHHQYYCGEIGRRAMRDLRFIRIHVWLNRRVRSGKMSEDEAKTAVSKRNRIAD